MGATTIKVEGALLMQLQRIKPEKQSISAFVRTVLEKEILRRQMADAASRYAQYLRDTPEERTWLNDWDRADLVRPPKKRSRR